MYDHIKQYIILNRFICSIKTFSIILYTTFLLFKSIDNLKLSNENEIINVHRTKNKIDLRNMNFLL